MARVTRHYLPGYVWNITHRCYKKKEFLLKVARERYRWVEWLFEEIIDYDSMKNLFGFSDLNHMKESHQKWINEALKKDRLKRENH